MAVKIYFDCGLLGYDLKMEVGRFLWNKAPTRLHGALNPEDHYLNIVAYSS
jgi:hypothetical protein